jgi:WD40 repeat protein
MTSGREVRFFDANSGLSIGETIRCAETLHVVRFSRDGKRVLVASGSGSLDENSGRSSPGTVQLWEIATGSQSDRSNHEQAIKTAEFSPDGKWIVTASDDGTARIWDASTSAATSRLLRHPGQVNTASFSPRFAVSRDCFRRPGIGNGASLRLCPNLERDDRRESGFRYAPRGPCSFCQLWPEWKADRHRTPDLA